MQQKSGRFRRPDIVRSVKIVQLGSSQLVTVLEHALPPHDLGAKVTLVESLRYDTKKVYLITLCDHGAGRGRRLPIRWRIA